MKSIKYRKYLTANPQNAKCSQRNYSKCLTATPKTPNAVNDHRENAWLQLSKLQMQSMTAPKTHDCNSQNSKISQTPPYSLISTHHIVIPCQSDVSPYFLALSRKGCSKGKAASLSLRINLFSRNTVPFLKCQESWQLLFPRATSQVAMLAWIFGDCREGQIPRCLQRCKFDTPLLAAGSLIEYHHLSYHWDCTS